jgi:hypothetical protein
MLFYFLKKHHHHHNNNNNNNNKVAAPNTPVEVMVNAGVPGFLVGMLSSKNDVVLGPAAIALAHLALLDGARIPICDVGAVKDKINK